MSTAQDSVQLQSLENLSRPLLDLASFNHSSRQESINEYQAAPSAICQASPAPAAEESADVDARSPLREVTKSTKGNQEVPEQEQKENQDECAEGGEKLNDYVTKMLDKITKQRGKVEKMNAILEKKGLLVEKENEESTSDGSSDDDAEEVEDDDSKENLSPTVRGRPVIATPDIKTLLANANALNLDANFKIEDVLQISRKEINYGTKFPGQIAEEHIDIVNKSGHDFVVQIFVSCLNDELRDTDEYVFSVRRSHLYDYNDKHYLIMAPYSCAAFKFALKVPNMRLNGKILGEVQIAIKGVSSHLTLDLNANVSIPKVFCPKELKCNGIEYPVIKLAVKEGKKQEMKIPFRNNGDVPVTLEFDFHDANGSAQEKPLFDCLVHPNVVTINPNSTVLTNVLVKPLKSALSLKGAERPKAQRKILVGRVRDSALVYSFVFWIELY